MKQKLKPLKKVKKDFSGVCELRQLPKGTFFRVINNKGQVSKETYTKSYYEHSEKKFQCNKHSDIWGNGRMIKGTQKVTTDFIY